MNGAMAVHGKLVIDASDAPLTDWEVLMNEIRRRDAIVPNGECATRMTA